MKTGRERGRFAERYHAVRGHARRQYYRVMPNHPHHRVLVWVAIVSYAVIVGAQLLYPLDRALPLATFAGQYVGWQTHDQVAALVQAEFRETTVTLQTPVKSVTVPYPTTGADADVEAAVLATEQYPFWWRYVPFSILWQPVAVHQVTVTYSDAALLDFSTQYATELTTPAINAGLVIDNGTLKMTGDTSAFTITPAAIMTALKHARATIGRPTVVKPHAIVALAPTTAVDFQAVEAHAHDVLTHDVTITAAGRQFTPSVETRATWLQVGVDDNHHPTLSLNEAKLGEYLDTIDEQVGTSPGMTHVTITDGRETARQVGASGQAIVRQPLVDALRQWVQTGAALAPQTIELHDVAPTVIYNNKYTATQAGLQAYLDDVAQTMDVHIAIQQIDGAKWSASVRADDSIPSASTYKLYVAKWLFTEMEAGRITWGDPILDTNVDTCFDRMTIASTNPCAQEWLRQYGRDNMNNFVYGLGFSHGTSFTNPVATHTTANDLRKYMLGLNDGTLVSGAYRDRLLHSLTVHPYRYGIPTGSKGAVQDKVGFLWDYVHDAAIVHHPAGTYIMVIMTKGQSYARIAQLTREIERIMYP